MHKDQFISQPEPESSSLTKPASIVDDFMYGSNVANSHVTVRLGFIRKVYGILAAQLTLTTIISAVMMSWEGLTDFIKAK